MSAAIELRGVEKSYGSVQAVAGVDLDVAPGEFLTLLGPSGCGKSTLLRLVAGFEDPGAGTIRLFGDEVAGNGRAVPPERRGVGLVFQQLALFPHLDVAANVGYGLRELGRTERKARVAELLELVDLADSGSRYPDQLSGGQAQRVALARALAPSPRVVLLDEPFSSLDTTLRASLRAEVRSILRSAGVTAVLVTHDQDEALSLGDRVGVMFDGRIVRHGAPREVYVEPGSAEVASFVGETNRMPGGALVRPEDLELTLDPAGPDVVTNVEYYGHDQAVDVRLASGQQVRGRLGTASAFEVGDRVRVTVARDLLEWLDMAVEKIAYDEFGLFHENAAEHGLPYDGPPAVRRQAVNLGDGRSLSSLVWGSEPPGLVLLHGGGQNAHTWDTVAMALGLPLVAIDLPGHGHSDGPAPGGNSGTNADDVATVIDALAPDAEVIVGMSAGGLTAIAIAARRPALVRSLVLVDILPNPDPGAAHKIQDFIAGPATFESFDDLLARTTQFNPTRSESSLRRGILHNAVQLDDGSWQWRHQRHRGDGRPGASPEDAAERMAKAWDTIGGLTVPVLLVRGMAEGSVVTDEAEDELRRRLPSAGVERVDGAGHSVQGDKPVELAAILRRFSAEVSSGAPLRHPMDKG